MILRYVSITFEIFALGQKTRGAIKSIPDGAGVFQLEVGAVLDHQGSPSPLPICDFAHIICGNTQKILEITHLSRLNYHFPCFTPFKRLLVV